MPAWLPGLIFAWAAVAVAVVLAFFGWALVRVGSRPYPRR